MNMINSQKDDEGRLTAGKRKTSPMITAVQTLSRIVTVIFLVALIWTIYVAVVSGNRLPVWAWLGVVTLLAVAVGLGVAAVVYRGVSREIGPFDFRPSTHVTGELKSESERVAGAGATKLRAEIKMTQGVLRLAGGATGMMDATFIYDDADWKRPHVEYAVDEDGEGKLVVTQPATHRPAMHQGRSEWDVRLYQDLPTELNVRCGAGKADLRLSGLTLTGLRVESGVGELTLDLRGEWRRSMSAFVKSGIGDTVLRLPRNAGVRIRSTVGLGSMSVHGLTWDGEAYSNALYGQAAANLDIAIEGGMGKIAVEVEAEQS